MDHAHLKAMLANLSDADLAALRPLVTKEIHSRREEDSGRAMRALLATLATPKAKG